MECKGTYYCLIYGYTFQIGIYPEWNVKQYNSTTNKSKCVIIGIYPEWNVKLNVKLISTHLNSIGIYPEWNVKLLLS